MERLILQVALSVFLSSPVFANNDAYSQKDSFALSTSYLNLKSSSTSYLKSSYTNKQLANFYLDLTNAFGRISETLLCNKAEMPKGGVLRCFGCLSYYISYYIMGAASTSLHEIGHALRFRSFGLDYQLLLDCNDKSPFKKDENFFKFFARKIFSNGSRACCRSLVYKNLDADTYHYFEVITSAGGMNNEIYLAERISDDIYTKNKGFRFSPYVLLPYALYLKNRLSPISYDRTAKKSGDDPFDITNAFKKKGLDFKKGVIRDAGIRSLFLSGTTYLPLYSFFTEKPLKLYGFRIPDVFPYITTKGISYKVVSGYEISEDLKLIFGFERVFKIEPATEYSLGIERTDIINHKQSYRGVVTFGQGLDLEVSYSRFISKYFSLGVCLECYSCKSLQGQRHATIGMFDKNLMFNKNGLSYNASLSISYRF